MSRSTAQSDAVSASLCRLAARAGAVAAPYDFAEFQRRAAARPPAVPRSPERLLRIAAMVAPLALLLSIVGVERGSVVTDQADFSFAPGAAIEGPALVRVGPTARVNDLEDRIAWIDTLISETPVSRLTAADRAALQSGREALASSLQRVRYAQTLLAY